MRNENGHEYISMHGYDMYDFGFRHYYATIGRFTSPDPLSERTPWQSPYVYASNNFTGEIDWMGLSTYTTTDAKKIQELFSHLNNTNSTDKFDFTGWDELTDDDVWYIDDVVNSFFYIQGQSEGLITGDLINGFILSDINITRYHYDINDKNWPMNAGEAFAIISEGINIGLQLKYNPIFWKGSSGKYYTLSQRYGPQRYVFRRSYEFAGRHIKKTVLGKASPIIGAISAAEIIRDMSLNGVTTKNSIDLVMTTIGFFGPWGMLISTTYGVIEITIDLIEEERIYYNENNMK